MVLAAHIYIVRQRSVKLCKRPFVSARPFERLTTTQRMFRKCSDAAISLRNVDSSVTDGWATDQTPRRLQATFRRTKHFADLANRQSATEYWWRRLYCFEWLGLQTPEVIEVARGTC